MYFDVKKILITLYLYLREHYTINKKYKLAQNVPLKLHKDLPLWHLWDT